MASTIQKAKRIESGTYEFNGYLICELEKGGYAFGLPLHPGDITTFAKANHGQGVYPSASPVRLSGTGLKSNLKTSTLKWTRLR